MTPLFYAVYKGHATVVELLLATDGVDHDFKNGDEETPLLVAAFCGAEKIVKLLLNDGANPNSQDIDRRTPRTCARRCGPEEVVRLLLSANGVNPNSQCFEGHNCPIWTAWGFAKQSSSHCLLRMT